MTPEQFSDQCRQASRSLRRLPAEVRSELRARVKAEVAEPVADDVRRAGSTLYARRAAGTTRVRAGADPTVVVGGAKRVASGGARGRDLVFGAHFGGGSRVTAIPTRPGRRGHRRHTTRQFAGKRDPFVFSTIARNAGRYLEMWADIITETIERNVTRNNG